MSDEMDFSVQTADSIGTVSIARVPIQSGTPADGQIMIYSATDRQWQYETLPTTSVFSAIENGSITPVASTNINVSSDLLVAGTDIVRLSSSTFRLQPGAYRLQFSFRKATFGAAGTGQLVYYQFYNSTTASLIGPRMEASGGTTVVCGVSIDTKVQLPVASDIGVRSIATAGTTPVIVQPFVNIYRV